MYQYEELMKENGLTKADLPKEIKSKIQGLTLSASRASTPADKIKSHDILICDAIQTFIERDYPDSDSQTPEQKAEKEAEVTRTQIVAIQTAIVNKINSVDGRWITKADLAAIIGRTPADKETIGDLKLYRVYLTEKYKAQR